VKNLDAISFGKVGRSAVTPVRNRDIGDRTFVSGLMKRLGPSGRKREPLGEPAVTVA